jgi:nucleoside-diphosphate-sugar epimerase
MRQRIKGIEAHQARRFTRAAEATLLLTGATGLVGGELFRRFLTSRPGLRFVILTRHPERVAAQFRNTRTSVLRADLVDPDLGLSPVTRRQVQAEVTEIIHCAADVRFDTPLEEARAANSGGTGQLLALARQCPRLKKFAYVSTVYVAGRSTGRFPEAPCFSNQGFVNTYQQSKFEAEQQVLGAMAEIPAAIFRLSTIIGDAATGRVQQFNYIHQLLKLLPHGDNLSIMPCDPKAPIDLITIDWVGAALAYLFEFGFVPGRVYQVCAGPEASLKLAQLIDLTLDIYASHPAYRKWQPIVLPKGVDLATWEEYVKQALPNADIIRKELFRVLSYFAGHLALFQAFENRRTLAGLKGSGLSLPPIRGCYERMVRYCLDTNWGRNKRATA